MSALEHYVQQASSKSVMEELTSKFSNYRSSPSRTRSEDMYAEGQRRAVEWIAQNQPPYFNDEFYSRAQKALEANRIVPRSDMDTIMLEAGRASVLVTLKNLTTSQKRYSTLDRVRMYTKSARIWATNTLAKIFG